MSNPNDRFIENPYNFTANQNGFVRVSDAISKLQINGFSTVVGHAHWWGDALFLMAEFNRFTFAACWLAVAL